MFYVAFVTIFYPLKTLKDSLCAIAVESGGGGADGQNEEETNGDVKLTRVNDSLSNIISLCHRNCQKLDQDQRKVSCFCVSA